MNSRVEPCNKTKYHVTNRNEYERALVQRGDITVWHSPTAIKAWNPKPSGRRGVPTDLSQLPPPTKKTPAANQFQSSLVKSEVAPRCLSTANLLSVRGT